MGIGVLISGNGTNLKAILDAGIKVDFVASNKHDATGLRHAVTYGNIPSFSCSNVKELESSILSYKKQYKTELIVCAGYMKLLSSYFLFHCKCRVINIHPSLLPSFPGLNAVQQALDEGVQITGITIHEVNEGMDTGPIIKQIPLFIGYKETEEELTKRIQDLEHIWYPWVIKRILDGHTQI